MLAQFTLGIYTVSNWGRDSINSCWFRCDGRAAVSAYRCRPYSGGQKPAPSLVIGYKPSFVQPLFDPELAMPRRSVLAAIRGRRNSCVTGRHLSPSPASGRYAVARRRHFSSGNSFLNGTPFKGMNILRCCTTAGVRNEIRDTQGQTTILRVKHRGLSPIIARSMLTIALQKRLRRRPMKPKRPSRPMPKTGSEPGSGTRVGIAPAYTNMSRPLPLMPDRPLVLVG